MLIKCNKRDWDNAGIEHFCNMSVSSEHIHPTAVIDPGALIGEGTRIWHFCHLMPKSRVGKDCSLGQNVFVDNNVVIGNGVRIQNNVSVYDGVTVEDEVFLGPSMVFTNVINPRSFISRKTEFKKTQIRRGATIGANATILCGVEIGNYALIGAGSVVLRDVPAYALMVGNPARQAGWVSKAGITLKFNDINEAVCPETGQKYKIENNTVFPLE